MPVKVEPEAVMAAKKTSLLRVGKKTVHNETNEVFPKDSSAKRQTAENLRAMNKNLLPSETETAKIFERTKVEKERLMGDSLLGLDPISGS